MKNSKTLEELKKAKEYYQRIREKVDPYDTGTMLILYLIDEVFELENAIHNYDVFLEKKSREIREQREELDYQDPIIEAY